MKKVLVFLLFLCVLTGCEGGVSADFSRPTDATPLSLMLELNDRTIHSEFYLYTDVENGLYSAPDETTAATFFGGGDLPLDLSLIENYAIRTACHESDEIIIISIKEESSAQEVKTWMANRIAARVKASDKPASNQNSLINQKGKFLYSVLCENASSVGSLLLESISAAYNDL